MIPVYIYSDPSNLEQGFDYMQFGKKFIDICNDQQKEGHALFFSFIFYDLRNAEVAEMLHNNYYWNSLNTISGKYLSIFYIDTGQNDGIRVLKNIGSITDNLLSHHFDITSNSKYPYIIFFQVSDSKILNACYAKIKGETIETTFSEIRYYVENVTEVLEHISDDNRFNHQEIYNLVERKLNSIKNKKVFKS